MQQRWFYKEVNNVLTVVFNISKVLIFLLFWLCLYLKVPAFSKPNTDFCSNIQRDGENFIW